MLKVKPSFANIVSLVRLRLTKDIEFTQKQVLKQIRLMKKMLFMESWIFKNEQNLKVIREHTCHVHSPWKRPDPGLDATQPPCRSQVGDSNVGLGWCGKQEARAWQLESEKPWQKHWSPPQMFIKVRNRRTHPRCTAEIRKSEIPDKLITDTKENTFWQQVGQERVLKEQEACDGLFSTRLLTQAHPSCLGSCRSLHL